MAQPAKTLNNFQLLVRAFSRYIKTHHHLQHVNCLPTTTTPARLKKMETGLIKAIHPAFPNASTDLIKTGNAKNWTYSSLQMMDEHYCTILEKTQAEIQTLPQTSWEEALKVAIRWTKKDIPTIKTITIEQAKNQIREIIIDKPQTEEQNTNQESPRTRGREPTRNSETRKRQTHSPLIRTPPKQNKKNPGEEINPNSIPPNPTTPEGQTTPTPMFTPERTNIPLDWYPNFNLSPVIPQIVPRRGMIPLPQESSKTNQTADLTTDPQTQNKSKTDLYYKRHEHRGDKKRNWSLEPHRPILILGDSNLANLPTITDPQIQVDCYPGANLDHAKHIIHKTPRSEQVSKVILSFGLNNRNQGNPSILKKYLRGMLTTAKNTFPQAEVFIPVINISQNLPENIRQNVGILNHLIRGTGRQIPRLARKSFRTQIDEIHWTPQTAAEIWQNWKVFLG